MSLFSNTLEHISKRAKGALYERHAVAYLKQQGLEIIQCNFTIKGGEIDIIAKDHDKWLFIEVKYRQSAQFGSAATTVNQRKKQRLQKTAHAFFHQNKLNSQHCYYRFDIIAFDGDHTHIQWLKNAF